MKKTVIALVGMIGAGKTTLINELAKEGYPILPENYMSDQGYTFDNRLILSKWKWTGNWFERIAGFFDENEKKSYVFTDNSALVSGLWTAHCTPLMNPIQVSFDELKKMSFNFIHVAIHCNKDILLKRIQERLITEPARLKYNENNMVYVDDLYDQYQQHVNLWDYQLDSTYKTPQELKAELLTFLKNNMNMIN